ncbi:MAG: tripartite tricarboxylate transporter family receptor [Hyphomicrobiales bacterium]|nr:tripartite tricarboxylate transporter family receptor [Hyphomicrobiales bacterium]
MGLASVRLCTAALALGVVASSFAADARADSVADFYRGKTVNVLIGVAVGGEYDLHARAVARYLGKYIPGNPGVVPQTMTGAGGLKMANYLYEVAPRDGTYIGMLANTFPAMQAAGIKGVMFDANKFNWIGSICPTVETMAVWKTTGIQTIQDAQAKEVIAGATGRGAITYMFPALLNEFAGTKFKIVAGYPGGNDVNLAMERGEVGARNNTWSSWKVTKPEWLRNKDITVLVQAGPKAKDLPNVPSVMDLIKNADDRKVVELLLSGTLLGRPLAAAPGVPEERVKALRDAFDAVMKDPDFLKEAEAANIEVDPVRGVDMQNVVKNVLATPKDLAERAKALIE